MRLQAPVVIAAAAALVCAPAASQRPGTLEFGGFLRFTRFDPSLNFADAVGGGGVIGVFVAQDLAIEATAALLSTTGPFATTATLAPLHARLVWTRPVADRYTVVLGAGYVHNLHTGSPRAWEAGISGLLGARVQLGPWLAARLEGVADYYPSPLNTSAFVTDNWNFSIQSGLSARLRRSPLRDNDHDGVADLADACSGTPRGEAVDRRGCTLPKDGDADGVVDEEDRCPGTRPDDRVDVNGCSLPEDTDGDGVTNNIDRCPNTLAGDTVDAAGCARDTDRDGVMDSADKCPGTRPGERIDATGCPPPKDSDLDGVMDPADRCPGTPAGRQVDSTGCPPLFTGMQRTLVLTGVNFATGSTALTVQTREILDRVATSLAANPDVRVEVAGYTDNRGGGAANLRLSQRRADAVRAYLIERGVSPGQITARGYGAEDPIDTNVTASGRARNRRVELHRLN